jgi:hypothetical protein
VGQEFGGKLAEPDRDAAAKVGMSVARIMIKVRGR